MKFLKPLLFTLVVALVAFESQATEMRLLTWNVYMLPSPIKASKQKMRKESIVQELSVRQEQYDVMVFQEMFSGDLRKKLSQALKATHPYTYSMGKGTRILHPFGPGLFILSKYPFEIKDKVYYKKCSGADCLAAKGAFLAELTLDEGKKIQVIVTHMQAGQKPKKRKVRAHQIEQLRAFMKRNKRSQVPQILAGDFNINSLSTEEFPEVISYLSVKAPFDTKIPETEMSTDSTLLSRLLEFASTRSTATECFGIEPRTAKSRLDHVWINDDEGVAEVKSLSVTPIRTITNGMACDLSDHLPLTVHLELKL